VRPRALAELVNTVVDEPAAVQFLRQLLLALQDLNPGKALGLFRREARFVGKTLDRDEALAGKPLGFCHGGVGRSAIDEVHRHTLLDKMLDRQPDDVFLVVGGHDGRD